MVGGAGSHAGDVEELEVANVVPDEEGLLASDLLKKLRIGWKAGGGGELVLRFVEAGKGTRSGEGRVAVTGEPGTLFGGGRPGLEKGGEVRGFDEVSEPCGTKVESCTGAGVMV